MYINPALFLPLIRESHINAKWRGDVSFGLALGLEVVREALD
jgi:hypothetical protein